VFGDGRQSRDFTFVDNVVEANLLAARAPRLEGESINVASGEPFSLLDVLAELQLLFGTRLEPVFEPDRPGDIRHSHANISRARELLGYEPRVGFREGLRRTAEWFEGAAVHSR
jgi:UDP-glucose 4-epimerase